MSWKYRSAKSTECASTSPNTRSRRPSSRPLGRRIRSRARRQRIARRCHSCQLAERSSAKARCASAGKLSRTPAWRARSISATAQPRPRGTRCRIASPVVDDHAVAVGLAPARMKARLRGCDNVTKVLDGARAQQRLPVRPPGGTGEGRGHGEQLRTRRRSNAGTAPGNARRSTPTARACPTGVSSTAAATPRGRRAPIRGKLSARPGNVDVEQVDLVVARGAPAVRVVHERGGGDPPVGCRLSERHRAAHDPQPQPPRGRGKKILRGTAGRRLRRRRACRRPSVP